MSGPRLPLQLGRADFGRPRLDAPFVCPAEPGTVGSHEVGFKSAFFMMDFKALMWKLSPRCEPANSTVSSSVKPYFVEVMRDNGSACTGFEAER